MTQQLYDILNTIVLPYSNGDHDWTGEGHKVSLAVDILRPIIAGSADNLSTIQAAIDIIAEDIGPIEVE